MHPTPYPELNAVLDQMVTGIREALGDTFVAAYLQGSFAGGGFDRHSDVDFIVVTRGDLSDDEVDALQVVHARVYDLECEWAQHLEGSYFPETVLRRCDGRGRQVWYLDHGSRELILSEHCNTAVVRWILHEQGIALAGPPPGELVDEVPVDVLRREIRETMHDWGQEILSEPERFNNRFYQCFIVLSYCRMLHDLHTGSIGSKREGAEWAKVTLDGSWVDLIDRTWAGRPNPAVSVRQPADAGDFKRTLEFIEYAIGKMTQVDR